MFLMQTFGYKNSIFKIGDRVDNVYLIVNGQVEISYEKNVSRTETNEMHNDGLFQLTQKLRNKKNKKQSVGNFRTIKCENQLFGYNEIVRNKDYRNHQAIYVAQKVEFDKEIEETKNNFDALGVDIKLLNKQLIESIKGLDLNEQLVKVIDEFQKKQKENEKLN